MDTMQCICTESNSPIDELLLERRRADVLVLAAAHRAALATYKQHVNESIERVLKLVDAAEAWGSGGEVPELATRFAATARSAFEGLCECGAKEKCSCGHCVADTEIAEFISLGFRRIEHPALVALGWVTGYVMGESDSSLESALDGIGEAFGDETNNWFVADKVSEAAYAAANETLKRIAKPHVVENACSTGGAKGSRPHRAGTRRKRANSARHPAQAHA